MFLYLAVPSNLAQKRNTDWVLAYSQINLYSDMFHGFRNLRNLTQLLRFLILQGKNLKHARLPDITIVNKL